MRESMIILAGDSRALNISFLEDDVEFKLAEPKSTVASPPRNFMNDKKTS